MATNRKRTGLYTAAGIAIAVVIIAAILAAGVQLPGISARVGLILPILKMEKKFGWF